MGVNGSTMSKSRRAKGYWIAKEDKNVTEIYRKFQNALALNPFTSESFLVIFFCYPFGTTLLFSFFKNTVSLDFKL